MGGRKGKKKKNKEYVQLCLLNRHSETTQLARVLSVMHAGVMYSVRSPWVRRGVVHLNDKKLVAFICLGFYSFIPVKFEP